MNILATLPSSDMAFITNVIGQSTAILALALAAEWLVRRHAAARHAVLLCGLVSLLVLPVAIALERQFGIAWKSLPVHFSPAPGEISNSPSPPSERAPEIGQGRPAQAKRTASDRGRGSLVPEMRGGDVPPSKRPRPKADQGQPARFTGAVKLAWACLPLAWLAGSLVCLVRNLTGWLALRRIRREASRSDLSALKAALGLVRQVWQGRIADVLVSSRVRTPLSAGLWRPCVLLPQSAVDSLSATQLRDVLLHEFAHVQRRDVIVVWLERLATLVYWPNPLLHRLNRLLDIAREDICDNYVLARGDALEYSRLLLEFKRRPALAPAEGLAACGLLGPRKLEERIRGLLDERRILMTRLRPFPSLAIVILFATLVVCLPTVPTPGYGQPASAPEKQTRVKPAADRESPAVENVAGRSRWEYKVVSTIGFPDNDKASQEFVISTADRQHDLAKDLNRSASRTQRGLNDLGAEGWELVAISDYQFIFKRPLASK